MLVSRLSDTEQSQWSYTKFETTYQKPTGSPRMSNHFDTPLSTQSDWQGQYSYLPPSEGNLFSQPFESSNDGAESSRQRSATNGTSTGSADINSKGEVSSPKMGLDPLGTRSAKPPSPTAEKPEPQNSDPFAHKPTESAPEESLVTAGTTSLPMPANALHTTSTGHQPQDVQPPPPVNVEAKEEGEEILDDEEMGGAGAETAEANPQPQTAAERTAQRRKMKRFRYVSSRCTFIAAARLIRRLYRLTHQQTRFLMSEFAKQPHPDAAHRERLSREIPGLSPRQVQVWFQNR